jgi:hypothetical protein
MAVPRGDLADRLERELAQLPGAENVVPVVVLGESEERSNPDTLRRCTLIPIVGQDGQQSVPAGDSRVYELTQGLVATAVDFDIPDNVDAQLSWNGDNKLDVADGGGRSGRFEAPDGFVFEVNSIRLEVTNNGSVAADIGLWVVVPR